MGLEFDIDKDPPSVQDIEDERARVTAELEALKQLNKRFLVITVAVVASVLAFLLLVAVPAVSDPAANQDLVFVVTYIIPYLFFFIFIVGNRLHINKVEKPRKALRAALDALQELPASEWERLMQEWSQHESVRAYCQRVRETGRALLKAEREAIEKHLATAQRQAA